MTNAASATADEIAGPKAGKPASVQESADSPAAMVAFEYGRAAELFPTRIRKAGRNPVAYKRFDTAAAAIRFAIEELPNDMLVGAYLQVEEERFGSVGIRRLYESGRYPLRRDR